MSPGTPASPGTRLRTPLHHGPQPNQSRALASPPPCGPSGGAGRSNTVKEQPRKSPTPAKRPPRPSNPTSASSPTTARTPPPGRSPHRTPHQNLRPRRPVHRLGPSHHRQVRSAHRHHRTKARPTVRRPAEPLPQPVNHPRRVRVRRPQPPLAAAGPAHDRPHCRAPSPGVGAGASRSARALGEPGPLQPRTARCPQLNHAGQDQPNRQKNGPQPRAGLPKGPLPTAPHRIAQPSLSLR